MKIVSSSEMREIDRITSSKYKVPSLTLMENAGSAVAESILQNFPRAQSIGVICGKGNNGGDGFVLARKLHAAGRQVSVLLLASPKELKGDAARMFKQLPVDAVVARDKPALKAAAARRVYQSEVLVDAILGTGFRPPLNDFLSDAIALFEKQPGPVVSVDIPSGMVADAVAPLGGPVARASSVVTFTAAKPALVFQASNAHTVVAQIGSPAKAVLSELGLNVATAPEVQRWIGNRAPDSNKGDYGHVLIIGGSIGKSGAPAMAGMAALRAGAGLVTVAAPRSVLATIAGFAPELMTIPLEETRDGTLSLRNLESGGLDRLLQGKTVVAIGPGLSTHPETADFVRAVVSNSPLPLVVDADGLNAFEGMAAKLDDRKVQALVVTPHPGEMARVVGRSVAEVQDDRAGIARSFAREHGAIVVLKGHRTLSAHPDGEVWVNPTGNPGMAKGGTGDTLTGIIAALVARQERRRLSQTEQRGSRPKGNDLDGILGAVTAAVYLHGLAGDIACDDMDENSILATDLIRWLPQAFRVVRERSQETFVQIA